MVGGVRPARGARVRWWGQARQGRRGKGRGNNNEDVDLPPTTPQGRGGELKVAPSGGQSTPSTGKSNLAVIGKVKPSAIGGPGAKAANDNAGPPSQPRQWVRTGTGGWVEVTPDSQQPATLTPGPAGQTQPTVNMAGRTKGPSTPTAPAITTAPAQQPNTGSKRVPSYGELQEPKIGQGPRTRNRSPKGAGFDFVEGQQSLGSTTDTKKGPRPPTSASRAATGFS